MLIFPKKWTHHHTMRLYHISHLMTFLMICLVIAAGNFFIFAQIHADQYSLPPEDVAVSATVPSIQTGPAVVDSSGSGSVSEGVPASSVPPAQAVGDIKPYADVSLPTDEEAPRLMVTVGGQKKALPTFSIQRPTFHGHTNIPSAIILLEIHSSVIIRGGVYADQDGNWAWTPADPVSPGGHTLTVTAQSSVIPELSSTASFEFFIQLPSGQHVETPQSYRPPAIAPTGLLFDVLVKIPVQFKTIAPGDQLVAAISLINFGSVGHPQDVAVQYTIEDSSGKVVLQSSETVAVATRLSLVKTFSINPSFQEGVYQLTVKVPSQEIIAASSDTFEIKGSRIATVGSTRKVDFTIFFQTLLAMLFLFGLMAYLEFNKIAVLSHFIKKIDETDLAPEVNFNHT
jgi:hypothetical protein